VGAAIWVTIAGVVAACVTSTARGPVPDALTAGYRVSLLVSFGLIVAAAVVSGLALGRAVRSKSKR
jgi:hypothetical protein